MPVRPRITIQEYQDFTPTTFIVERKEIGNRLAYLYSGLAAEGGEVAGNYAKYCRNDFDIEELTTRTEKELGDVMYFVAKLAHELGSKSLKRLCLITELNFKIVRKEMYLKEMEIIDDDNKVLL